MITLHHLESSRSLRIIWLMEELGVAYEIERYERDEKTSLAPLDLLKIHPLGKSPVISDGDLVVAESGAIIEYLVNKYDNGALCPPCRRSGESGERCRGQAHCGSDGRRHGRRSC